MGRIEGKDDERAALLDRLRGTLTAPPTPPVRGRVRSASGLIVRAALVGGRIGDMAKIGRPMSRGGDLRCEVVGVESASLDEVPSAILMPLGALRGVAAGDPVELEPEGAAIAVGDEWLGRAVDAMGEPIDGGEAIGGDDVIALDRVAPTPLARAPVTRALATGVVAIDGLLTLGEGARIGLFSGPGTGKSSLLSRLGAASDVDVVVHALIGERGREVGERVRELGQSTSARSIVIAATSDASPLERVRAVRLATCAAESFRDRGRRVLLLVDSLTRVARAQRDIGLAIGEPPTRRGFPASVFALMPRLLERACNGAVGSLTAVYAVLVEGGDASGVDDPIAEDVRGLLDGHWVLDPSIAARGRFPPIDVTRSVSRTMEFVVDRAHIDAARRIRASIATLDASRDLVAMGAHRPGNDRQLDAALAKRDAIERWLSTPDSVAFGETRGALLSLARDDAARIS